MNLRGSAGVRAFLAATLWVVTACATATRFVLELPREMQVGGTLELRPMELQSSNRLWVTAYGPRNQGAFARADATVFDASLRDTLIRNRVFNEVFALQPSSSEQTAAQAESNRPQYILTVSLLNHILAGNEGGIMEITATLTGARPVFTERFAVYCAASPEIRIFDCLNRAVIFRLVKDMTEVIGRREKTSLLDYSGALYYDSAMDAAARLPGSLTQEECLVREATIFGGQCVDSVTIRLRNIDWKALIRTPERPP